METFKFAEMYVNFNKLSWKFHSNLVFWNGFPMLVGMCGKEGCGEIRAKFSQTIIKMVLQMRCWVCLSSFLWLYCYFPPYSLGEKHNSFQFLQEYLKLPASSMPKVCLFCFVRNIPFYPFLCISGGSSCCLFLAKASRWSSVDHTKLGFGTRKQPEQGKVEC